MANYKGMITYAKDLIFEHQYEEARKVLEILEKVPECHDEAVLGLAKIDVKEGNYQRARNRLIYGEIKDKAMLLFFLGELETHEYNYNSAREIYQKALSASSEKGNTHLAIGRLDMLTGELIRARKTFQNLADSWEYHRAAAFHLTYLDIMEGKYGQAEHRLLQINKNAMSERNLFHYRRLLNYIRIMNGTTNKWIESISKDDNYALYRLIHPEDRKTLLEHIERHKQDDGKTAYFMRHIHLENLLEEVKELSKSRVPSFYKGKNQYRMRLPYEIGVKDGVPTRNLTLVTYPGTEIEITMYPGIFSTEFDREGMSSSVELIEKREKALQKVKEEQERRQRKKKTN